MLALLRKWGRLGVFVIGNALIALAIYLIGLEPALDYLQEQRNQIDRNRIAIARAAALIDRKEAILQATKEAGELVAVPFIRGESPGAQSSELLVTLRQIAEAHGMVFELVATLPTREWNGVDFVGARVELTTPSVAMAQLLSMIESGPPFLFVQNATLTRPISPGAVDERVTATLEIYGAAGWRRQ